MRTPKVGIREFRSGLAEFIAAATPVAITRHGHTVAYFIPTSAESEPDMAAALKRASGSLDVGAAKGKGAGRRKAEPTKRVARGKHERKNG
ncbi:MAG: type II toxin-antitoxin system Phd/YefM family antitoxin [Hyphomonas sp.]|jgi:antitoxin (DNA-binding transcriptional repressor) of toxin-antitoxin stability system|nr:type II toxin-antitoxin system Phd/YefM family antitoxin [Hyphomonas sp.]